MLAIVLAHLVADDRIVAAAEARRELEVHLLVIDLIHLDRHDFLQLFDTTLHLYRLGWLISESLYKVLDVSDFLLLVLVSPQLLLTSLLAEHEVLVILHLVVLHPAASDFEGTIGYIINKGTVVAHQDHCLGALGEKLLQPLDTLDVEVVGRLIEQEYIRLLKQDFRQLDTHTPTTGELLGRTLEIVAGEAKTSERALNLSLIILATHHHIVLVLLGKLFH